MQAEQLGWRRSGTTSPTVQDAAVWTGNRMLMAWLVAGAGFLFLCVPTFWTLFQGIWATEQQGHGPIVLAVTLWLFYKRWPQIQAMRPAPRPAWGWPILVLGLLFYIAGRSQAVLALEVGSLIWLVTGIALLLHGPMALRVAWFALFFMLFMVPLPGSVVDAVTQPMKMAVSNVAETAMHAMGYPISRTGVVLQVGQYQLLVADACAGLHTLFILEAMGLLYLNVVRHTSPLRNVMLALLVVPISFTANVFRVIVLSLITFHFGDEAGQGFLHGFAGMVLFLTALLLIIAVDGLLRRAVRAAPDPALQTT